jgi:replicative DNA helicase
MSKSINTILNMADPTELAIWNDIKNDVKKEIAKRKTGEQIITSGDISSEIEPFAKMLNRLETGDQYGFSTGFASLDNSAGRIDSRQMWVFGAPPAVGKSYLLINMALGMLAEPTEKRPNVAIFSTELSKLEYFTRIVCMRAGIWSKQLKENAKEYRARIEAEAKKFTNSTILWRNQFRLFGDVSKIETIEATLETLHQGKEQGYVMPDIVFVDFIQQLSVGNVFETEKAMPLLVRKFYEMKNKYGVSFVLASQLNIKAFNDDHDTAITPAFSYGKELNQFVHGAFVVSRKRSGGRLSDCLKLHTTKIREGEYTNHYFRILPGFGLKPIDENDAKFLDEHIN